MKKITEAKRWLKCATEGRTISEGHGAHTIGAILEILPDLINECWDFVGEAHNYGMKTAYFESLVDQIDEAIND